MTVGTYVSLLNWKRQFELQPEYNLHFWLKDSKLLRKNSSFNILKMFLLGINIFYKYILGID